MTAEFSVRWPIIGLESSADRQRGSDALLRDAEFRQRSGKILVMTVDWMPFGLDDEETEQYEVLVPGVPTWLKEPLIGYVDGHLKDRGFHVTSRCLDVQLATRIDLGVSTGEFYLDPDPVLRRLRSLSSTELLRLVDYIASERSLNANSADALALEKILKAARSKWTVGKRAGKVGLVERVPEGVQASVEGAIQSAGSAGKILARAWAHVHGLQPNDSAGYADAVRAVEIAAIDVVEPNNKAATLGTVIGVMRSHGDWRLPLREHQHAPSTELILTTARTLWHGHRDRHGSVDYSDVTHEEARAAVALASTLVEWFASGAVARRTAV